MVHDLIYCHMKCTVENKPKKKRLFATAFAQKCQVIDERDPKSLARYITLPFTRAYTHKRQQKHRKLLAFLFRMNSVVVL